MRHWIKKRKKSVEHTSQCPFPSLYMAKCSVKSLSLGGREKIKVYSKEIKATSGAIKTEVSTPKQNPLPVVLLLTRLPDCSGRVKYDSHPFSELTVSLTLKYQQTITILEQNL